MSMKVLTSIVQMYVYLPGLHANMPLTDPTVLLCDMIQKNNKKQNLRGYKT